MDEETKAAFAEVKTQLDTMMTRMNDGFERVIKEISTLKTDLQNSKSFFAGGCHCDGPAPRRMAA